MSYHMSSLHRRHAAPNGEPEWADPAVEDSWFTQDGRGRGLGPHGSPRGPRFGAGPVIAIGVVGLMLMTGLLPILFVVLTNLFSIVLVPFLVLLVPVVALLGIFWPVVLFGALGWGVAQIVRLIGNAFGPASRQQPPPLPHRHGGQRFGHGGWGQFPHQMHPPASPPRTPPYGEPIGRPAATPTQAAVPPGLPTNPELAALLSRGWEMLDRSRKAIRRFPDVTVRRRASAIVDQAEQILDTLREGQGDLVLATKFVDRYLAPTTTLLERYARLANRGLDSAQPVLERVADHDLPMIARKFRELYERLHRGDVIDLEVASEMLDFELGSPAANARD